MRTILLAVAIGTLAGCGRGDRPNQVADSAEAVKAAPTDVALKLPPGFTATVFARDLGGARHVVAAPNNNIYVNTWRSPYDTTRQTPPGGFVVGLRDTDGDGKADLIQRFGSTSESGSHGGTGIAIRDGALYVEADSNIVRYVLPPDSLVPIAKPQVIVTGLPTEGGHPMHPIAVDARNLFVNLGSATNSCQAKDRELESPGLKPCRELEARAGIWRFDTTAGQRFSPGKRYATGIRNAVGLAVNPRDQRLYATQHGRDQLADNWPKLYNWKQSANLPAEELLQVERGADYGWPYCYHDSTATGGLLQAPEYGGDGKKVGDCAGKRKPVAIFPAHWAPNALAFYGVGKMFPSSYRGGAFIAFHGSWNRAPEPQDGYNVVFQPMANGKASGPYQVLAEGFAGPRKEPGLAAHRPSGLAVGPDGALYISDDQRGTVWRVSYSSGR
jgi:glucose/arabinose dehydrogenase